jgi:hypothetical protein
LSHFDSFLAHCAKVNWLMRFSEIIAVYTENHTKHINTFCRQNAGGTADCVPGRSRVMKDEECKGVTIDFMPTWLLSAQNIFTGSFSGGCRANWSESSPEEVLPPLLLCLSLSLSEWLELFLLGHRNLVLCSYSLTHLSKSSTYTTLRAIIRIFSCFLETPVCYPDVSWRRQSVTRMFSLPSRAYLSDFLDCEQDSSAYIASRLVTVVSGNSNCFCAFSSSNLCIMLAIIFLPSLWTVVFIFLVAIMYYSDLTTHTRLEPVCGNSTAVHIHCT